MTKKHLVALAAVIKDLRTTHGDNIPAYEMQLALARMCADSCANFNAARFEVACEPE